MKTLDEQVAEKMGWSPNGLGRNSKMIKAPLWKDNSGAFWGADLPDFSTDWNDTKIVIKFMRERGYEYGVDSKEFSWSMLIIPRNCHYKEIIDDNLPLAACKLFLQIDLEVK